MGDADLDPPDVEARDAAFRAGNRVALDRLSLRRRGGFASPSPITPIFLSIIARIVEGCDAHVSSAK